MSPSIRSAARLGFLLFGLTCLAFPTSSQAQQVSDQLSARAMGMGGAFRALNSDPSAVDLNPAAMTRSKNYQVDVQYRYQPLYGSHMARAAFLDNLTSSLASAVAWDWELASAVPAPPRDGWNVVGEASGTPLSRRTQSYRLGFALPIGPTALGTTLRWQRFKLASATALESAEYTSKATFDAAFQWNPVVFLSTAVIGNNLLPTRRTELPTTATASLALSAGKQLAAEADLTVDFTSRRDLAGRSSIEKGDVAVSYHVGGIFLYKEFFPLRLGYYTEAPTQSQFLTAGLGLEGGQLRLNYAIRLELDPPSGRSFGQRLYHVFELGILLGSAS